MHCGGHIQLAERVPNDVYQIAVPGQRRNAANERMRAEANMPDGGCKNYSAPKAQGLVLVYIRVL